LRPQSSCRNAPESPDRPERRRGDSCRELPNARPETSVRHQKKVPSEKPTPRPATLRPRKERGLPSKRSPIAGYRSVLQREEAKGLHRGSLAWRTRDRGKEP